MKQQKVNRDAVRASQFAAWLIYVWTKDDVDGSVFCDFPWDGKRCERTLSPVGDKLEPPRCHFGFRRMCDGWASASICSFSLAHTFGQGGPHGWHNILTMRTAVIVDVVQWSLVTVLFVYFTRSARVIFLLPLALIAIAVVAIGVAFAVKFTGFNFFWELWR